MCRAGLTASLALFLTLNSQPSTLNPKPERSEISLMDAQNYIN